MYFTDFIISCCYNKVMGNTGMMKRILAVLVLVSVMLISGCMKDKYSGEFKNDEEVADM